MKRTLYFALVLFAISALSACSSYHYYKAGDDYLNLKQYRTFAWAAPEGPGAEGNFRGPRQRRPDDSQGQPPRRRDFGNQGPRMQGPNRGQASLGARLNEVNNNKYFNNPEAVRKIQDAAVSSLQSKGLVMQPNNPDLLVRYTTIVDRGSRNGYAYTPYYGLGWGGWGGYGGWGWRYPYFGLGWGGGWGGYGYGGGYPVQEHFKEGVLAIELIDTHTNQTVWIGYGAGELSKNREKAIAQLPKVVNDIFKQLPVGM
ncbi:DUF4136 domain-containing protein [Mucilaginibacter robiniae]|uniref:DUF4136 domain-containing protein n=1 Tax=Mucilaginibacter robiniae TaxID=2728022 RepID=A0A7L5DZ97_9SPHI|nr:DUF4136 domain-containing protein [Mucilaginibacter robiniae]QJD95538.1 DUF4136 domain-containing protein [Mucilaginibacter robiniae]